MFAYSPAKARDSSIEIRLPPKLESCRSCWKTLQEYFEHMGRVKQEQTWNLYIITPIQSPSCFWSVSNLEITEETIQCLGWKAHWLLVMINTAFFFFFFAGGNCLRGETFTENLFFSCFSGRHDNAPQAVCSVACLLLEGTILWRGALSPQEVYHSPISASPQSQRHSCPGALSKHFHQQLAAAWPVDGGEDTEKTSYAFPWFSSSLWTSQMHRSLGISVGTGSAQQYSSC